MMARIHVHGADDCFRDSSLENRICAWGSEPDCGTGLERNVERCASRHAGTEVAQTLDLGVVMARSPVMSPCHYVIVNHQHCAHGRIRARLALCLFGFFQGFAHEPLVQLSHSCHGQMDNCDRSLRQMFFARRIGQVCQTLIRQHG